MGLQERFDGKFSSPDKMLGAYIFLNYPDNISSITVELWTAVEIAVGATRMDGLTNPAPIAGMFSPDDEESLTLSIPPDRMVKMNGSPLVGIYDAIN